MEFSILCKTISLFLFIFHTRADELNVFPEPGTQEDTTSTQGNNLALSATSPTTTALFQGITDADALQQHDQDQSNQDVLLLASENPDCAASSSSIIHSPAGRSKTKRLRFKRSGAKEEGLCEWQEFKDDGSETTTTPPEDYQLRGKRRRPKPGAVNPGREPVPVGPLMNPGQFFNPELAPYKVDKKPNPQKCPFGQQNIPVCYPKVAPPQIDPALILSPCRTDELVDPCDLESEDMWCCRELYLRVLPNFLLVPPDRRMREFEYNRRYPNSASFCMGAVNPLSPPYPIWLWP